MSVVNILTPGERRFLAEALELAEAKEALEESEVPPEYLQGGLDMDIDLDLDLEQQHLVSPSPVRTKPKNVKPPDALARFSEQLHQEYELWDRVERSLELPFVYRSEESKTLSLKMLRRIPVLQPLSEGDLEVICSHMEVVQLHSNETLAGKPPFALPPTNISPGSSALMLCDPDYSRPDLLVDADAVDEAPTQGKKETRDRLMSEEQPIAQYVYVLLRGRVVLRIPSLRTAVDAFVEPYEMFAMPVTVTALPPGSRYETDADCMLLRLMRDADLALDRVIGRLEKRLVGSQVTFLRRQLRAKVFTHWTQEEFEECARALVPLRVSWRQVIVDQGDDSDAMYFIKEGQCIVVRKVPLHRQHERQQQKRQEQDQKVSHSSRASVTPLRRRSPLRRAEANNRQSPTNSSPSSPALPAKLMELVTLREGEFFGELGLLNHCVDWKPDVVSVWSGAYWHNTLHTALRAPVDIAALEGEAAWRSAPHSPREGDTASEGASASLNKDVFPSLPMKRQATVYTKCPCVILMLTYDRCRDLFGNRVYAQLKEFARGYPSCEDIEVQYERQRKWLHYRKALANEVMSESSSAVRQQPKLSPIRFR
ncbi:hypothetical protein DQ04_04011010 [Trypanosoma grayi]|uniref:hypothetical protein n=1 Tax=Trypanosoma grayi TaxID=71804 RepID=UPI0004F3F5A1|nr:hypothetical protein DQ04_04011010 [Trypanosoma grayi]KEG10228.1 hypothetical protein DQ04_04011010 [Trypanosoma grayi]